MSRWDWDDVAESTFRVLTIFVVFLIVVLLMVGIYKVWNEAPKTKIEEWGIGDYAFICEKTDHSITCRLEGKQ